VIVALLIAITYYRLPWRKLPDPGPELDVVPLPEPVPAAASLPQPQAAKADAYAESP
jgi:alpha-1,6-mannosyltransferase